MSPSAAPSTTRLWVWQPHIEARPVETRLFRCKVKLSCFDFRNQVITNRTSGALISPGEPYSVLPPSFQSDPVKVINQEVACDPPPSWFGVPCKFVRVRMGLPMSGSSIPRLFWLLALLPVREVEDMPPYLRLGAQFFDANNASLALSWEHGSGELVIP